MKNYNFNKTKIAASISMLLGASLALPVVAQEAATDDVEVIAVRGIKASLINSSALKRDASGVVDAISAEEMGKFPDTNLAESLQRITGVSVSRANGEGSQITVRGFGPSFNLITLNGRQMPGAGFTRSYDLANLSSEGVSALEVYKTARADLPSGGLGATVNIVTTKPLNSPGQKFSVSAKGMYDTSNEMGDDVTPEFSAIYSNTFADDKFGVAVSFSHQERSFQQQSSQIDGWQANVGLPGSPLSAIDNRATDVDGNPIAMFSQTNVNLSTGQKELQQVAPHFFPRNLGYNVADFQRERTNGQLTLQFAPTDNIVTTLDYTMSEAITSSDSTAFGVWFNYGGNIDSYELDQNGTVSEFNETANDYAHTVRRGVNQVKAESLGFNLEWEINDSWSLEFDAHNSTNEFDDGYDKGTGNNGFIILGPDNLVSKTYSYDLQQQIPQVELFWPNDEVEALRSDFDSQFAQFFHNPGKAEVSQYQLDVEYLPNFDLPISSINFGVAFTDQLLGGTSGFSGNQGVVGYEGVQGMLPDSMFTRNGTGDFLDQFSGGGANLLTDYYYTYSYDEALTRHLNFYSSDVFQVDAYANGITGESYVQEETLSLYASTSLDFDIQDKYAAQLNLGLRYEETDVTSTVRQRVPVSVVQQSSTEWITKFDELGASFNVQTGAHDLLLPMIDFKVDLSDDIVARASWGKTISRAPLGNLAGVLSLSANPKPGSRTGGNGNPNLQPFESTNLDLSLEYYYAEGSYAAVGYFKKDVKNFISFDTTTETYDGLFDVIGSDRYNTAVSQLQANGDPDPDVNAIYDQMIANGGAGVSGTEITGLAGDPLVEWLVSIPQNTDAKAVDGIEVAAQHLFGDTGFGLGANATFVEGDVEFDVFSLDPQAPLVGLSDSANFQAFYEKDGLSVKFTYAWRDSYLLGVGQSGGSGDAPPQFAREFGQWDMSVNYDVTENVTVFFEGVNLNNETEEAYGRFEEQFLFARQYGPRYLLGVRLKSL